MPVRVCVCVLMPVCVCVLRENVGKQSPTSVHHVSAITDLLVLFHNSHDGGSNVNHAVIPVVLNACQGYQD